MKELIEKIKNNNFIDFECIDDFYKQVWERLIKDSIELSKNE